MFGSLFIIRAVQKVISAAQMREVDRLTVEEYRTPSLLLMEAAAARAASELAARFSGNLTATRVQILCGPGNNGGDGAALARALWMMGIAAVDVLLLARLEDTHGDARTNFEIVSSLAQAEASSGFSRLTFRQCDTRAAWEQDVNTDQPPNVIVDALFGTGLTRPLGGLHRTAVEYINRIREIRKQSLITEPLIISLDLPSGLNADSALVTDEGVVVSADVTVTFTAPKAANVLPPASELNGQLVVAPVGSPQPLLDRAASQLFLLESSDAQAWLKRTRYTFGSYKNTHGHVLVVAGSRNYTGAPVLTSEAAMRAGAGLVTVAVPRSALSAVAARLMPEIITTELPETSEGAINQSAIEQWKKLNERATVVAIGPGLSSSNEETRVFVRHLIQERTTPVIIDADALNCLAPWPADLRGTTQAPLILTPHLGEMRRLIGADDPAAFDDRVAVAREFAVAHDLILVLKGARTLVAAPDGRVFVNPTGNPGLGTAGAGDTLTGIIAAFNAQAFATLKDEADAIEATLAALYVSGLAGDITAREGGMRTMVASDIREHLSEAICQLDPHGEQP